MEEKQQKYDLTDFQVHEAAMSLPIGEVVRSLVSILGATTVAAIGNVTETRAVNQWMQGREPQHPHVLRFALQLALMIGGQNGNGESARAWFQGSNPHLADQIPALMLRTRPLKEIQQQLVAAARSFAAATRPNNT